MRSPSELSRRKILGLALGVPLVPAGMTSLLGGPAFAADDDTPGDDGPDLDTLVAAIAFSPDGRTIAGGGKSLRLWDVASGQLRKTFDEGAGTTSSIVYAPDGRFVACGSGNAATVRCQDVLHDKLAWEASPGPVATLASSHDGRSVLSGGLPFDFKQWDTADGRLIHEYEGHAESVQALAFSPDDRLIASGSEDKTIRLWDAASGKALATLPANGTPSALHFAADGRSLVGIVAGDESFDIVRLDLARRALARQATVAARTAETLALSKGADLAAIGRSDALVIVETAAGKTLRTIPTKAVYLDPLAFSPDRTLIAKGGEKQTVLVWEVASGKLVKTLRA